jgi:hypothetical protein
MAGRSKKPSDANMNTTIPVILLSAGLVSLFLFNGVVASIFLSAAGVAWVIALATDRVVKRLNMIEQNTARPLRGESHPER